MERMPAKHRDAPVDDDHFHEMVAIRAFEKAGADSGTLGRQSDFECRALG